jgi:hypothetical protein
VRVGFWLFLLVIPSLVRSQTPGTAVDTALAVLTGGLGGCTTERQLTPYTTRFFPAVRFTRAQCVLEHGDSATAIVGLDADSVLYLLASTTDFNFLVARHPAVGLDSASALSYAYTALELSGNLTGIRPVASPAQVPVNARKAVRQRIVDFPYLTSLGENSGWKVVVVTRSYGGYYPPSLSRHDLLITTNGELMLVNSVVLWNRGASP